jgi:pimeloyl-ACP methyl ester carboxylesterase
LNPFFFGESGKQLFGVYEPAQESSARPTGVLLCNPYGQEAIRVHRIFRVLSDQLARAGCHVMRFDYYGTGDSAGDCVEGCFEQWQADILAAHDELRDTAGVSRIIWIGLRLGGTLAALAARRQPPGLTGVVLWDPVIRGKEYLAEMASAHWEYLSEGLDDSPEAIAGRRGVNGTGMREALGFERSETLHRELEQLNLLTLDRKPSRKAMVVAGSSPPTDPELAKVLTRLGTEVTWVESQGDESWNSDEAMNAFMVPRATLTSLVGALERWR